jgi:SAM-dependent methyltransferase
MTDLWARTIEPSGQPGPDYWNYFARRLVEFADIPKSAVILDIGTDNGNVLFKAMEKTGVSGLGVGMDIDLRGLQVGLVGLRNRGYSNMYFAQMDADFLAFPPKSFDVVLANFVGWDHCYDFRRMEFTALDRRIPEIKRVLKPGGKVGVGFWTEQCDIDWIADAFKSHIPEYFESTRGEISSYSKENVEGYRAIFQCGGFDEALVHLVTSAFVLPDEEAWWRQMKHAAREYFDAVPDPDKLERFKAKVFEELQQFRSDEGVCFDKTVAFIFSEKRSDCMLDKSKNK